MALGAVSEGLASCPWVPWRLRHLGGPLNTLLSVHVRRRRLLREARSWLAAGPHDVTVIFGVRNRADYRLANALESVRTQEYPQGLIEVLVVDFGSDEPSAERLKELAARYRCVYVRAEPGRDWSRAACLNIGIRRARGKFVLTADTDIMFSARYVECCVSLMTASPLSMVYSQCLDLSEASVAILDGRGSVSPCAQMDSLRARAVPRFPHTSSGICFTATRYLHMLRGYDETFKRYACEDEDLEKRLGYLGLSSVAVPPAAYYLHQWHPTHEGVASPTLRSEITKNEEYLASTHSIVRNTEAWGMTGMEAAAEVWADPPNAL